MKFCTSCGTQIGDAARVCPQCGAPQAAAPQAQAAAPQAQAAAPQTAAVNPKISTWDGGVLDTIANSIVASLLMTITCGIGTPWAICYMMKFVVSHAIVDGKRLSFTGTGGSLFGNWIKWFLLTLITCGIYSFWVTPRLYKWIVSNIHVEG